MGRDPSRVEVYSTKLVLDDVFKVEEADLSYERFDGTMSSRVRRLKLERGDSVAALLYNVDSHRLLLINQFRYPTYGLGAGWLIEAIAGMVDKGESPEEAARREVEEETGYEVLSLEHVATFFLSPGGSSERIVLYYGEVTNATRPGAGGGLVGEGEDIALRGYTLDEAWAALDEGTIQDAKTIIGLQWLRQRETRT